MHNWKIGNDWNKYKKVYMSTHFTAYLIYLCGYSNKFSGDLNLRVAHIYDKMFDKARTE